MSIALRKFHLSGPDQYYFPAARIRYGHGLGFNPDCIADSGRRTLPGPETSHCHGNFAQSSASASRRNVTRLQWFVRDAPGGTAQQTLAQAKAIVGMHVGRQAFVSAVNDVFVIAGIITALAAFLILVLKSKRRTIAAPGTAID